MKSFKQKFVLWYLISCLFLFVFFCAGFGVFFTENVHAVTCSSDEYCADTDPTSGECERCAKIGGSDDIEGLSNKPLDEVLVDIIGVLAAIFGGIFILMMLVGAMMMMFGETANMKEMGKATIQWAVVGGVVGLLTGVIWLFLSGTFG